ncbi:S1C family serine protease [Microbacterium sp. NPDC091313]
MNETTETPDAPQTERRKTPWYRRRAAWTLSAAAVVVAGCLGTAAVVSPALTAASASQSASITTQRAMPQVPWGSAQQRTPSGQQATTTNTPATDATASESSGLVLIDTVLGYDDAEAAGTGIVIGSDGLVLTNNHVISGSTQISVTVASTGKTYQAVVVGSDSEDDIAVLRLTDASGLTTATIDDDGDATVGSTVTAVGNAEGGGVLKAADGTITAVDSTVTTSAEGTTASETLDGMIEIAADIVSGDSGGAVLDGQGEVVGVTTAASTGPATTVGYAIPIDDALAVAEQIIAGDSSHGATIGYPAFLGVQVAATTTTSTGPQRYRSSGGTATTTTEGALVGGVIVGTPAATSGLQEGDVITAIDSTAVTDAAGLSTALAAHKPGDTVTVTWTDAAGAAHSAKVTLVEGPAA